MSSAGEVNRGAWAALGAVGLLFLVVGLSDLVLAWVPARFGDADWELGTVSTTFNNFPVPAMGLGLAAASGAALAATAALRAIALLAGALAAWSLLGAILFALALPLALGAATDPAAQRAVFTSAVKTGIQIFAYSAFFLWIVRYAWTRSR